MPGTDDKDLWRCLGSIEMGVKDLQSGQGEMFRRLRELETVGCAKGKANSERLAALEGRPRLSLVASAGTGAGAGAVILALRYLVDFLGTLFIGPGGGNPL